jgi:DNA-binding SARP family transcriptional activator
MPHARISLFGRFRASDEAGIEIPVHARKAQQMLALLALHAPEPVHRERLTGLLWGDLPEARARHNLRQLLSSLRKDLPAVRADGGAVTLDGAACSVDLVEFRALASRGDPDSLRRMVALYRGPLLEGAHTDEDWLAVERRRLADAAASAMARLAAACAQNGRQQEALAVLQRWLELEPCAEEAYRLLMRTLDALGDRAAALQQYQRCSDALQRELGVGPGAETAALYRSLRDAAGLPAEATQSAAGFPAVAVFPMMNLTRDIELGALCAALGEDLGGHLARLPGFEVLAERAVAAAVQEAGSDIRRVARALRARYVVTGSLRRLDDGMLRVAIQLLEGENAQYLWTQLIDLPPRPKQPQLDELLEGISAALEQQLTVAASKGAQMPSDAWGVLRRASSVLFSRGWSQGAVIEAIELYRAAVAIDPGFALARAQKALIIALSKRWGLIDGQALHEEARADAERALAMEPNNSEVLGYA